jgi:hypothetical protein
MKAQWLRADGTAEEVAPVNGSDFQLPELQRFVGGYIERVSLRNGDEMWLNEEGKLMGLPVNWDATDLFQRTHGPIDVIVGDVLVCPPGMTK